MSDDDREPTIEERRALLALPREATPPDGLEDRVVAKLRQHGQLRPRRSGRLGLAMAAGLFLAGLGLGALGGRWIGPVGSPQASDGRTLFLLLLYEGPGDEDRGAGEESKRVAEYGAWARDLRRAGRLVGAEKLEPHAHLLGEGASGAAPIEARGYFLVRAASLEEAIGLAQGCPHLRHGGRVAVQAVAPT